MFQYFSYPILLTCTVLSNAIEKISDTFGVFFINGKEALMITGVLAYSQITVPIINFIKGEELVMFSFNDTILNYIFVIGLFHYFQAILYHFIPHHKVFGTITPKGNKPSYNDNGLYAWLVTGILEYLWFSNYSLQERRNVFENLGEFQQALNYYGMLAACYFYFIAVTTDTKDLNEPEFSNNPIIDFYKGVELHNQNRHGDSKMIINSRVGMMLWGMINILAVISSDASNVKVSGILQLIYITKFFIWESGYAKTSDITLDRCGYYLFWGCICYVPCIYTSPTVYHYYNPNDNYSILTIFSYLFGIYFTYTNWEIDCERTRLREMRERLSNDVYNPGFIKATYETSDGKTNTTYLVACGWMKIASNINYFYEISTSLVWTLGGTIPFNIFCYTYVIYLTVLLVHRTFRLERKCKKKYGKAWESYRELVPYKIIPGWF